MDALIPFLRARIRRLIDLYDCWRGDHDWYTKTVWGPSGEGVVVRADPCSVCGHPNPRYSDHRQEWKP